MMKSFIFIENPKLFNSKDSFVAHIRTMNSVPKLFEELCKQLEFPDYFGFNWNALFDCLTDFNWINESEIVLVHDQKILIDDVALKNYIDVLYDALNNWKEGEEHSLKIIFPLEERFIIETIIGKR